MTDAAWLVALSAARGFIALALVPVFAAGPGGLALRVALLVPLMLWLWPSHLLLSTLKQLLSPEVTVAWPWLALVHEIIAGLALGLAFRLALSVGRLSGATIEASVGDMGPRWTALGATSRALGLPLHLGLIVLFVLLDGPMVLLDAIALSFQIAPIGAGSPDTLLFGALSTAGTLFVAALSAVLPILVTLAILELSVGLAFRGADLAPSSDTLGVARALVALLATLIVLRPVMLSLSEWLLDSLSSLV